MSIFIAIFNIFDLNFIKMESTKENSLSFSAKWSHAFRFGILAGLLTIGVTLMGYLFAGDSVSFQQQGFFTMGSFILVLILAVQAVKSYRNEELNGFIHFKDSFQVAAMVGAVCGFLTSLFNLVYLTYVDASFIDVMIRQMEEMYLKMGMNEGQVEQALVKLKEGFSLANLAKGLITGPIIYALFIGLIGGLIGRKKNHIPDIG
jgi:hypothetical protein